MSPASKLGLPHWLPPFGFNSPWEWMCFTLLIDAGVLFFCWWGIERIWHRQYYLSNLLGDTLGLPAIAFGSAEVMRSTHHTLHSWYTSPWWLIGLFLVLNVGWFNFTFRDPAVNRAQRQAPSSIWHTTLWPYFAFIMLAPAPAVLSNLSNNWWAVPVLVFGIVVWCTTYVYDVTRRPPPLGGGVQYSWKEHFAGRAAASIRLDEWQKAEKALPDWFYRYYDKNGRPK